MPAPPPPAKPDVWLFDTSTLITLAADDELAAVVRAELSPHRCVLFDVVVDELEWLADVPGKDQRLVQRALTQLGWLGPVVDTAQLSDPERARAIQELIAGTRPLRDDWEHWAESVIIDIARRLTMATPILLSEDHSARVEANQRSDDGRGPIASYSVHKLLSRMVRAGRLPAEDAEAFAVRLVEAGRARHTYTAEEFRKPDLGRVGRP